MFIRWEKRKRKTRRWEKEPKITLQAVLVENYRKDGRVRQRCIKKLASIHPEFLQYPIPREIFLEKVSQKLESIGVEKEERESILASFSEKIPEISADDSQPDRSFFIMESLKILLERK